VVVLVFAQGPISAAYFSYEESPSQGAVLRAWSHKSVLLAMFSGLAKGKSFTLLRNNQTITNHIVLKLEGIKQMNIFLVLRTYLKFLRYNLKLLKFSSRLFC
jgi:hypothetical protein